jgi:hypothetical protein
MEQGRGNVNVVAADLAAQDVTPGSSGNRRTRTAKGQFAPATGRAGRTSLTDSVPSSVPSSVPISGAEPMAFAR